MFKYLIHAISQALGFSKTESRGTLVLIIIIFIAIVGMNLRISYLKKRPHTVADSSTVEWVKKVQTSYDLKQSAEPEFDKSVYLPTTTKKKKYAVIESKPTESFSKPKEIIRLDLNLATSDQLQTVHGIGPSYSERIVKYRDLLGGFADTTQLHEVYGLKQEVISELLNHFHIGSGVRPIDLNIDSIKVLAGHPYISYDLARILINYRKLHGDFKSADDLRKIKAIDDRTFIRLKPYLK